MRFSSSSLVYLVAVTFQNYLIVLLFLSSSIAGCNVLSLFSPSFNFHYSLSSCAIKHCRRGGYGGLFSLSRWEHFHFSSFTMRGGIWMIIDANKWKFIARAWPSAVTQKDLFGGLHKKQKTSPFANPLQFISFQIPWKWFILKFNLFGRKIR